MSRLKTSHLPHFVYYLFDEDVIVYVGATHDVDKRIQQHRTQDHEWIWQKHHVYEAMTFNTSAEALSFKKQQIAQYQPRYNVTFTEKDTRGANGGSFDPRDS